jgi:hypothetical protein
MLRLLLLLLLQLLLLLPLSLPPLLMRPTCKDAGADPSPQPHIPPAASTATCRLAVSSWLAAINSLAVKRHKQQEEAWPCTGGGAVH